MAIVVMVRGGQNIERDIDEVGGMEHKVL